MTDTTFPFGTVRLGNDLPIPPPDSEGVTFLELLRIAPKSDDAALRAMADHESGHVLMNALCGVPLYRAGIDWKPGENQSRGITVSEEIHFGRWRAIPLHVKRLSEMAGPIAALCGVGEASYIDFVTHARDMLFETSYWPARVSVNLRRQQLAREQAFLIRWGQQFRPCLDALSELLIRQRGGWVSGLELCQRIVDVLRIDATVQHTCTCDGWMWLTIDCLQIFSNCRPAYWIRSPQIGFPYRGTPKQSA